MKVSHRSIIPNWMLFSLIFFYKIKIHLLGNFYLFEFCVNFTDLNHFSVKNYPISFWLKNFQNVYSKIIFRIACNAIFCGEYTSNVKMKRHSIDISVEKYCKQKTNQLPVSYLGLKNRNKFRNLGIISN